MLRLGFHIQGAPDLGHQLAASRAAFWFTAQPLFWPGMSAAAITAILTAPIFIIPLLILRIPLVLPIFVLYFFLSFLPFVGAWITGIFAVLIAFGAGGLPAALIIGKRSEATDRKVSLNDALRDFGVSV